MSKVHEDNAGYIGVSYEETQDPYFSYNKLALPLAGATETVQRPAEVTHTVTVAGGKFVIGGVSQATLSLTEGGVYKFDQSDSSNSTHPFKFSQTSDGTWSRGTEYTKGVSYVGTPGSSGAYTQLVVPFGGLDLYYYCGNHTGMGGSASTPANAEMFTAALPILKTTDQFGASAPTGGSAVLVEGDPSSSTSNPFGSGNGYSIQFDGNDRLRILGGTIVGDFTYECWFNMDSGTSGYRRILSTNEPLYSSEQTMIRLHTNGNIQFYAGNGTPEQQGGTGSTSTWYHAAIVRSGDTISYYIDGSRQGTDTYSASIDIPLTQVCLAWGYGSEYFTGKISNVRVSNNARYTGVSHTVPTSTFSSDSNTLLLAAHTNSLATAQGTWSSGIWSGTEDTAPDPFAANLVLAVPMNGSNNGTTFTDQSAAIKGSGSAKTITLYSGSSTGGAVTSTDQSNYYGSSFYVVRGGVNANASDYITRTGDTDLSFGTGDFTVEFWFYPTSLVSNYVMFDNRHPTTGWPSASNGFSVYGNSSGTIHFYSGGSNVISADYAIQNQANQWHHFAVIRNNGYTSLLINGETKGSVVDSRDYNQDRFVLGSSAPNGEGTSGYFNDLRIYKGVAKYQPEESGDLGFQALSYYGTGNAVHHIGGNIFSQTSSVVGGTVSDAQKAFNGSSSDWANLTASSTSTAAHVDFMFQRPIDGITRIEAAFDSPSGSGDTRGRFNGANGGATRTGTGSGYSDIYNGASITVTSVGFAINQNSTTGTNNDIVSRFRVTDSSGTRFLINGNGSNIPFKPDFVWLKNDDSSTGHHCLYDSVRGVYKHLQTSSSTAEYTENAGRGLSAFNSDGFTIDTSNGEHVGEGNINVSGQRYSAYAWKAGGAATTIAAGSIHSAATNSAQTWSNLITTTGNNGNWWPSYPATYIFDSTTTNYGHPNGDGSACVVTLSLSTTVTCNSSVTFIGGVSSSGAGTISINGGTPVNLTTGSSSTTETVVPFSGSISSIVVTKTSTGTQGLLVYGFKIDGIRLTDNTAFTVPAVPSIASSVSANNTYGFSITSFTVGSAPYTVGHNLGDIPKLIILKSRTGSGSTNWPVYHDSTGNQSRSYLNLTLTASSGEACWNNTSPTSSVFSMGSSGEFSGDMIAYCWSEVANYSKISSYTGTGASGNVVTTGFRPSFLLIKADIDGEDWIIMDDARSPTNPVNDAFFANNGTVPSANSAYNVDFNDDGFTVNNTNPRFNTNTETYYYMAIAGRKPSDPGPDAFKLLETLNIKDQSSSAHAVTNNGASFQTSVQKFYGGAADFSGNGKVTVSGNDFAFGTGDYTIEMWVYHTALGAQATYFGDTYGSTAGVYFYKNSANYIGVYYSSQIVTGGTLIPQNSWVHVAAVRNAGTTTVYVNGSPDGSGADSTNLTVTDYGVGETPGGNSGSMEGYIQDVRVYKGIAKYTSSFSPPERSVQGTARRYPSGIYVVS